MIAVILFLQLVDLITSAVLLNRPGYYESNPIMASIMDRLGIIPALVLSKGVACVALVYFQPVEGPLLGMVLGVYTWVIYNNLRHLIK